MTVIVITNFVPCWWHLCAHWEQMLIISQSVQNAAARLVSGVRRRDHITPTLRRLHWLPVRQRVLSKIAVLIYQCLNGQAPSYLADDCQLVSDIRPRRLRSSDSGFCAIRRSRTTYGDQWFAAAGPRVWNSLPTELIH